MFEDAVQQATLDVDAPVVVESKRKKGLFRFDLDGKDVPAKGKRERSLPQDRGSHTLYLNRALSGVQPPRELTPRTRSKATSLSLMGIDTSMATDSVKVVADKRARCSLNLRCTGHRATRRCYTCVEYNPQTDGNYCDGCFDATHPWYRVKHHWVPLAESDDPRSKWVGNIEKADIERKMEELGALLAMAQEAGSRLKDIENTAETRLTAIATATVGFNKISETVEDLKDSVGRMYTKKQAATLVQNAWRRKVARRNIKRMIRDQWQKFQDKKTGKFYYMNDRTGAVSWEKPRILGSEDLKLSKKVRKGARRVRRKPRVVAAELTTDQAARMLQGCYRNRQARKRLRRMVREQYKKVKDVATGKFYYYNTRTKQSYWTKPKFLGAGDLDQPEARTPRFRHWELTQDEAAFHLQGMWRARQGRRRLRILIRNNYRKKWDSGRQKFYYFNKKTGESHWTKPLGLGPEDLKLTPRTIDASGWVEPARTPRFTAKDLTPEEAAAHLQGMWRARQARVYLRRLVRAQYKKVYDADSKKFYYFNARTGESHWTKPIVLGSEDLELTPRTMLAAGVTPPRKTPRFMAKDLSPDEAAIHLQGVWRARQGRKRIRAMVRQQYKKVWDPSSGTFYYYCARTGVSHWTKPLCLGSEDLELTPRTMLAAGVTPPRKTPRFMAKDLSPDEAAIHLQGVWRARQGRKRIRAMVRQQYKKVFDPRTSKFYYYCARTKTAHWTKPLCLGSEDLDVTPRTALSAEEAGVEVPPRQKRTPRFRAKDLSEDEAAIHLQGIWRARQGRRKLRAMIAGVYQKVYDPTLKKFYYFNTRTKEARWDKPAGLGSSDLELTPRSMAAAGIVPPKKPPRFTAKDLTPGEAATHLQGVWRARIARRNMRKMLSKQYEKVWDAEQEVFYYINKKTGESRWEKPKAMGSEDIPLTARTAAQAGIPFIEHHTPRFTAKDLSREDAAKHIQGMWRARQARVYMRRMLAKVYQKVYDAEQKKFYYFNTVTKQARWDKPVCLGSSDLELTPRSMAAAGITPPKKTPRFTAKDLTPEEAATHLQGVWRARIARRNMRKMLSKQYEKVWDANTQMFYYINKKTGAVGWEKPKAMGSDDIPLSARTAAQAGIPYIEHHTPRFTAKDLTEDEAARHVQGMWRSRQARIGIRKMMARIYQKVYDPESKRFYYYNTRTKETRWDKPIMLGSSDLELTPRSMAAAGITPPKKTPRFTAKDLTPEEAALHIQGIWRARIARRLMRKMIADVYEKKFDPSSKSFFYFNKKTEESHWTKPSFLHEDIDVTARTYAVAKESGMDVPPPKAKTPRFTAATLTPEEAALHIQGAWRARIARRKLRHLVSNIYTKKYDKASKKYFYVNKKTGESHWEKPTALGAHDINVSARTATQAGVPYIEHHTARFKAEDLTPEEAAIHIQGIWRARIARRSMRRLIREVYRKKYDPVSKMYFYLNTKTNVSYWEKPVFLGADDLELTARTSAMVGVPFIEHHTPRFTAETLTEDEAATHLQGIWRARVARRNMRRLIREVYVKKFDSSSGKFFYYNTKTKVSHWEKPIFLGATDINLTARTIAAAKEYGMKDIPPAIPKTPRFKAKDLTEEEAALHIQGAWRRRVARRRLNRVASGIYKKGFDPASKKYYYVNTKTKEAVWEKPKVLGSDILSLTPRSELVALNAGMDIVPKKPKTPRFRASEITEDEAALYIQGSWRRRVARRKLRHMVASVYQKKFDAASKRFFYYNTHTKKSFWEKPKGLGNSDINVTARTEALAVAETGVAIEHVRITPRFTAKDLTVEEAAVHIQGCWRRRSARARLHKLASGVYVKTFDEESGTYFYTNKTTGKSVWEKPKFVGIEEVEDSSTTSPTKPKTPRFHAVDLTDEEAAVHLQQAWRSSRARKLVRTMVQDVYTKSYDHASKTFYYTHKKSGESVWTKPKLLGSADVEVSPRSKEAAIHDGVVKRRTPRFKADNLTVEEAALHIQGAWRRRIARRRIHEMAKGCYTRHFSQERQSFYYRNEKTGVSVWEKPKVLGNAFVDEVDLTARSRQLAEEAGVVEKKKHELRFHAADLSNTEAALHVQKCWRGNQARRRVYNMLTHGVYKKGFDVNTKEFYYFNTKTKIAMWKKPMVLGTHEPNLTPRTMALARGAGISMKAMSRPARYKASDLTKDEAAMIIQLCVRRSQAQRRVVAAAQTVYQKGYDPEADVFFYYNVRTGQSQWNKPKFLHSADVELTARSFIGARKAGHYVQRHRAKTIKFRAKDLIPDEGATHLQAWWRGALGRRQMVPYVSSQMYKGYDVDHQSYYWYNMRTKQSRWTRPWFLYHLPLDHGSLPLTARSAMHALEGKMVRLGKRKLRKKANQMTRYEAAFMIQGMYKGWRSRKKMRLIVRSFYEKLYDAERGTYYYYNKQSGTTSWYKPAILGSSDIRRSFVHTGSLPVQVAAKAAARAARLAGYTMGEAALAMLDEDAKGEYMGSK
jgi:hypothetical protein